MQETDDVVVSEGWHWTYGWMRRPDLDVVYTGYAYEDGDGTIMIFKDRIHRKHVYLMCCKDQESGELYLRVNTAPRICDNWKRYLREKYVSKRR